MSASAKNLTVGIGQLMTHKTERKRQMDGITKLRELIEIAEKDNFATAEYGDVTVEINGGVPIYLIGNNPCTAPAAMDRLDDLCA